MEAVGDECRLVKRCCCWLETLGGSSGWEFGRCCKLKVDVEADKYTTGGTADSGSLVERCNNLRSAKFSVDAVAGFRTHKQTNSGKLSPFLVPLWASVCAALQMIYLRTRTDSDPVRPTLNPPNIQGSFSRLKQGHRRTQRHGKRAKELNSALGGLL